MDSLTSEKFSHYGIVDSLTNLKLRNKVFQRLVEHVTLKIFIQDHHIQLETL